MLKPSYKSFPHLFELLPEYILQAQKIEAKDIIAIELFKMEVWGETFEVPWHCTDPLWNLSKSPSFSTAPSKSIARRLNLLSSPTVCYPHLQSSGEWEKENPHALTVPRNHLSPGLVSLVAQIEDIEAEFKPHAVVGSSLSTSCPWWQERLNVSALSFCPGSLN